MSFQGERLCVSVISQITADKTLSPFAVYVCSGGYRCVLFGRDFSVRYKPQTVSQPNGSRRKASSAQHYPFTAIVLHHGSRHILLHRGRRQPRSIDFLQRVVCLGVDAAWRVASDMCYRSTGTMRRAAPWISVRGAQQRPPVLSLASRLGCEPVTLVFPVAFGQRLAELCRLCRWLSAERWRRRQFVARSG